MANKRISSLDDITLVGGTSTPGLTASDIIPVTDIDDTTGSLQGTTKKVTVANLVAVAPQGDLESANNLSDLADAATARTNLGVDAAGTDNSTNVTLDTTSHDYLSLTGQTVSLGAIDLSTDVTGLLPNTSVSGLGTAATTASTDYATASHTHAIDDLSDVDTSTTAPTTNDFLKWGGSNWVPAVPTADVDGPLTIALRGTDNPHIGAYPEQSFKVIDNPQKLVMVVANDSGDLDFLLPDGGSIYLNTPTGGRLAPGFGFSVSEDASEPDIEVAGTLAGASENYSVISGDSDSKGGYDLPIRQGFNLPDIGANPAPILISGGSIA